MKLMRHSNQIVGKWKSYLTDQESVDGYGIVTLEFKEDGNLIYTIHEKNKDQIILLKYMISQDLLVTNQPSSEKLEYTRYYFSSDDKLILVYNDEESKYTKCY